MIFRSAIIAFMLILLVQASAKAQDASAIIKRIDSLAALGLPKSALAEVEKLDNRAHQKKDAILQIKAIIYRNQFLAADKETGTATIIARLQKDIAGASFPLRPVLHTMLGGVFLKKYQDTRGSLYRNPDLPQPGSDITKWSARNFFTEMDRQFSLALRDTVSAQETPIGILDGVLEGDTGTRYLRPTLYDLLLARAMEFYLLDDGYIIQPKTPFDLTDARLFGDSESFCRLQLSATDATANMYKAFKLLQRSTAFHLKKHNAEALAQLDMKRLMYLYRHQRPFTQQELYIQALATIAGQPNLRSAADALTLLGNYYKDKNDLVKAVTYYDQVIKNYPNSLAAQNSAGHLEGIKRKYAKIETENPNVPGRALLASVSYTNVKRLQFSYYKMSEKDYDVFKLLPVRDPVPRPGQKITDARFRYVSSLKSMREQTVDLPDPKDHKPHVTEFKIDPLEKGMYVILMKDADSDDEQVEPHYCALPITGINYLPRQLPNGKISILVADRQTGKPTANANIIVNDEKNYRTDKDGIATLDVNRQKYTAKIFTPGDSLILINNSTYGSRPADAEAPVINTIIYPDREIYRPGQTIYFSGLHVQTIGDKDSVMANASLTVSINHNYDNVIGAIPVTTNEFGTFHGSFVIPMHAIGTVTISVGQYQQRAVRVEEYKRPAFKVEFDPITKSYYPNDSVTLSGTVRAYAGFGISNAKIAINSTRDLAEIKYGMNYVFDNKLVDPERYTHYDTLRSDALGRFSYRFKATNVDFYKGRPIRTIYKVNATVIDGNNETQKASTRVVTAVNNVALLPDQNRNTFYAERDTAHFKIWLTDQSGMPIKGKISATIYALKSPAVAAKERVWYDEPDLYLMDSATYQKYFPSYIHRLRRWPSDRPLGRGIGQTTALANGRNATIIDLGVLKAQRSGAYRVVFKGEAANGDTITAGYNITWYDKPGIPVDLNWCAAVPDKDVNAETRRYYVGNGKKAHVFIEVFEGPNLISAKWRTLPAGAQQEIRLPLRRDRKELSHQFTMFWDNQAEHMYFPAAARRREKLDIKLITYRDKLQPGEKEQWKLQIGAKGKKVAPAQMVATMYDATIDNVYNRGYNQWSADLLPETQRPEYFKWERGGQDRTAYAYVHSSTGSFYGITRNYERLKQVGYRKAIDQLYPANFPEHLKEKRPGYYGMFNDPTENLREDNFDIYWDPALREIGVMRETVVAGDYVTRREVSTPTEERFKKDELIYPASMVTLSTITPRTNFNETAFFYPQLQTDKNGQITIDFTMPQSLTQWWFKAIAHTKDLATGYIEQNIVTQKQLSISAGMPRFFRSGDTVSVAARVANLTDHQIKGNVLLRFFNALDMKPIKLLADTADALQKFNLEASSNRSLNFKLIIPDGIEAITYRAAAEGDEFTDAEENTLPVLSKQVPVMVSMPMMLRPGEHKTFSMDALSAKHSPTLKSKTLTLEYTQNPAWYAIQALPTLTDAADECPEQLFGSYFANVIGTHVVNASPAIKQVLDRWRSVNSTELLSNLEKNAELKTTLLSETPWLRDAQNETEQKRRLALLLDLNQMKYFQQSTLEKLQKKQLPDGGFAWFGGNRSDSYITRYILAGMGQLAKANIINKNDYVLQELTRKAVDYTDTLLVRSAHAEGRSKSQLPVDEIYSWHARSYFLNRTMSPAVKDLLGGYIDRADRLWQTQNKYEQGLIALTMLRFGEPMLAQKVIKSLNETAQHTTDMGMYWAKDQSGYYWYQEPIETQCLMIELFTEAGNNDKAVDDMKIWLLRNKQANGWRTTKATVAACFALLLKNGLVSDAPQSANINIGGKDLSAAKPGLQTEAGTGYFKTSWTGADIKPAMAKVDVSNSGTGINWGALYWQYLEDADKVKPSANGLQLERKYFIVGNNQAVLVDAKHQPKPGDLLKVLLYVKADRDMEYIHLKDSRPSGSEPVDVLSTYKYQNGIYYYMATRDVSTSFYIDRMAKGSYVFEYQIRAAQPGKYSSGLSTIQSMYAPEISANAAAQRIAIQSK